jgi:hypothetical protein
MAKDLKFQGAMILFGTVICFFSFIFLLRMYFVNTEGFEVIQKNSENPKCPANNVMVIQSISEKKNNVACYPDGLVNVDKVFMNDNQYIRVMAPKGSLVTLFAGINGTGTTVAKISDSNNPAKITNPKFKSIRVQLNPSKEKGSNPLNPKPAGSESCKLSPAAKAAADAADAATAAAANAAAKAIGVDPDAKDPYVSATPSVFSVTCPSGEPIVAFGATKPPSLDSQLGKFGGAGVKKRINRKVDFSLNDEYDDELVGADHRSECQTADSQPADVDTSCSLKPARSSCARNKYAFDPETEY